MRLSLKTKRIALLHSMLKMLNAVENIRGPMNDSHSEMVGTILRQTIRMLRDEGFDSPALDARLLVSQALGCQPDELLWRENKTIDPEAIAKLEGLVARRLEHEPMAYICGRRDFWKSEFIVSPETLIPRPDSETLIESVLAQIADKRAPLRLLDLGTGSGCLLLSLLMEMPFASGIGIDKSVGALAVAQQNAHKLGLEDRAQFHVSDWFSNVSDPVDIVIANPPYIVDKDVDGLDKDVRDFEPRSALDGGPDGLNSYRVIAKSLSKFLTADGVAAFEIGADQTLSVREVFETAGFFVDQVVCDMGQRDRCLVIRKNPSFVANNWG